METKSFEELKANPKNPRQISDHDAEALSRSMTTFGDLSGIVFNIASQQLVGGHQRITILHRLPGEKPITITDRFDGPDEVGTIAVGYVWVGNKQFAYREVDWPLDRTDPETGEVYSAKEAAANIAANRAQGNWDLDLLAQVNYELSKLADADELLTATGQTPLEVNDSLAQVSSKGEADPSKEPREPSMILRIECESDQQMNELYSELRERGLKVKLT